MTRIRRQVLRVLTDLKVPVPAPPFDSVHAIRVTLQFIDIAFEECTPRRLVGYGRVPDDFVAPLAGALQEMKAMVSQLDSYVAQGLGGDLEGRLQRLSTTGNEVELIRKLREVIYLHGLVEFRSALAGLVGKLESPAYEIAVFGRVSSGKSSLLNRVIGLDVLPVGVTPVTTVPTRIKNGEKERLLVWFAGGRHETLPIQKLDAFVTEEENPANAKQVTKLLLEITSPRLPSGVTLVDTPGLGSLALAGAAETIAYLPRCDLGVVVVDASSSIAVEDIGTIQKLYNAGTPAVVLLSKIDLVDEDDRNRLVQYTSRKIQDELGIKISVRPFSSRIEVESLLERWIEEELLPRYSRAQELARESVKRKAGALCDAVITVLEAMSGRSQFIEASATAEQFRDAETRLRLASGQIETCRTEAFEKTDRIRWLGRYVPAALAKEALCRWNKPDFSQLTNQSWIRLELVGLAQSEGQEVVRLIQEAARQLTEALDAAGRLLPGAHIEDRLDLAELVKNMPVPEPKLPDVPFRRPSWLIRALGLARWRTERLIKSRIGSQITDFFTDHGRLLELWTRSTLSELEHAFEERAEGYRAQLQRLTGRPELTTVDHTSVSASLDLLKQYSPAERTSTAI
jgi:GTP-binding protein EngB required for normal cell division